MTDEEIKELMKKHPDMCLEFALMNIVKGKKQKEIAEFEEFSKAKRHTAKVDSKGNFIKE